MEKKSVFIRIVDFFIILLNITNGMCMLRVWFLDPLHISYGIDLCVLTILAYFFRFGAKIKLLHLKRNGLYLFFLFVYFADIIQNMFISNNMSLVTRRIVLLINVCFFMEYIYALYLETKSTSSYPTEKISKPYDIFSLYNVGAIILCAALIYIGVLSPYNNPIRANSLTFDNQALGMSQYYFIGHLSLGLNTMRGMVDFGIPLLTGLSHEPHVLWLLIGPSFFLLLLRFKNSSLFTVLLYITFLLVLIISTSTVAIIVFVFTITIEQLYSATMGKQKIRYGFIVLAVVAVVSWLMYKGGDIALQATTAMVEEKASIDSVDEGSMGFSMSMLQYMISPHSVFGRGNMPDGSGYKLGSQDIGLLSFILDIIFFAILTTKAVKLILSKDTVRHYWGMAFLYFLLHQIPDNQPYHMY